MTGTARVSLTTIAGQWSRLGVIGFGGPPAHIALLRELCVRRRGWLTEAEFEDAVAATNLLPGPASTQLAIYCAWRLRGAAGAILGGVCFIAPGLVAILALAAALLAGEPSRWVLGAAAGAGAAVAAVAVHAARELVPASWRRTGSGRAARLRWLLYLVAGVLVAAVFGAWVLLALVLAGAIEALARRDRRPSPPDGPTGGAGRRATAATLALATAGTGGLGALVWTAFKAGALSVGGGFVIVPLMQADALDNGWMTAAEFLYAVALGQITPGPVLHTVAAVGYAAGGLAGGLLAAAVAFAPSFAFIILGGRQFDRLRGNAAARAFLTGAGPAAIGAIGGSAILLAAGITQWWQLGLLLAAAVWLLVLRRGVVSALLGAGAIGLVAAAAGWPLAG